MCIFEWDSTDYPELYAMSTEANDYDNTTRIWSDYAHLNSVVIDPADNNFICSIRNFDAVTKINRTTGELVWILGGNADQFGISGGQYFRKQYDATITEDGAIVLFDNGCLVNVLGYPAQTEEEKAGLDGRQLSRALYFKLDEEAMSVTEFQEYSVDRFFSATMGSVQIVDKQNSMVLFGWGGKSRKGMPLFSEVDCAAQKVLFEVLCYDPAYGCYRVNKYPR